MKRLNLLLVTFVLASGITGMFVSAPQSSAQTDIPLPIFDACLPSKEVIAASALPEVIQGESDKRVIDLERCPVNDRIIRDIGVGSVLPLPGEGVYAEALTTDGAQVLEVERKVDGIVVLESVGSDLEASSASETFETQAADIPECQDNSFFRFSYRLYESEPWYFNQSTTPSEVGVAATRDRLLDGGVNIASVRNDCGIGDGVGFGMRYEGDTSRGAGIDTEGNCVDYDGVSVVIFGDLPADSETIELGGACQRYKGKPGTWDKLTESNIKLNKADANWTTDALADSCRGRYGVEAVMTHERGHTFGLDHVSEGDHGNLTMSTKINGTCQASENTLGRGDANGLNGKY